MAEKTAKTINESLAEIQQKLKAPKGQYNSFAKFNYRSCEDILEAVKPLLGGLTLVLSDSIVNIGSCQRKEKDGAESLRSINYVCATAKLSNGKDSVECSAYAREAATKKGMDDSQITGAASSYARKYALNGLFAIDDTKDSDTDEVEKGARAVKKVDPDMASEAQEKKIFALGKKLGKTPDQTKEWVKKSCRLDSFTDLTKRYASEIIEKLIKMEETAQEISTAEEKIGGNPAVSDAEAGAEEPEGKEDVDPSEIPF